MFSQTEVAGCIGTGSSAVLVTDDLYKNAAVRDTTTSNTGTFVVLGYANTIHRSYLAKADGRANTLGVAGYNRDSGTADTRPSGAS